MCMDEWMDGWTDVWMHACSQAGREAGSTFVRVSACMHAWVYECMHLCMISPGQLGDTMSFLRFSVSRIG